MSSRFRVAIAVALILSLAVSIPAFAGGWAVVTLDGLPVRVVAGEPLTIGFMVRQHGISPAPGLSPTITFTLPKEEQFTVTAKEDDITGHYSATVTLPKEGDWNWIVEAYSFPQPMPVITVVAPTATAVSQPVAAEPVPYMLIIRMAAFGLGMLGLFFALRTKSRAAFAVTALCLAVGLASFIPGSTVPKVEAQDDLPVQAAGEASISQAEFGRRLFIAKGCITCHLNDKAQARDSVHIEMGAPNLTSFSASEEVLRLRLKDPASVNSNTKMPDLNLSEAEIEALIAFINSK
ncbi:MAG: hypothetical protein DPW18_14840 [Chloroflexi bacterium]|nr:hypothetical protein [Chloroflexota bacterium]MDL1942296.1 c-type cytochrome [Chloroflexi bacterium CFX2]